jgi:hypothetical protein
LDTRRVGDVKPRFSPALRRVLEELAMRAGVDPEVVREWLVEEVARRRAAQDEGLLA